MGIVKPTYLKGRLTACIVEALDATDVEGEVIMSPI